MSYNYTNITHLCCDKAETYLPYLALGWQSVRELVAKFVGWLIGWLSGILGLGFLGHESLQGISSSRWLVNIWDGIEWKHGGWELSAGSLSFDAFLGVGLIVPAELSISLVELQSFFMEITGILGLKDPVALGFVLSHLSAELLWVVLAHPGLLGFGDFLGFEVSVVLALCFNLGFDLVILDSQSSDELFKTLEFHGKFLDTWCIISEFFEILVSASFQ